MKYEVTITYTEAFVSAAAKKYWLRKYLRDAIMSIIVLGVVSYFFFVESYHDWVVGFMLAVALIYTITVYAIYFLWRRRALALFRSMGEGAVKWSFADEGFMCESSAGKAQLKWSAIKKLWCYSDVWMLFYASGVYSTLPVDTISGETKNFIEQKIREAGGHVEK